MTDWTVYLEFAEGTSSKFWRARVEGKTLYVNYGKIGSNGQTQVKELGDASAATAEYDKLVREKRKKGYVEGSGAGAAGAAQVDDDGDDDEPLAKKPAVKAAAPAAKPLVAAARSPAGAAPGVPGHRLRLDAGNRQVDTTLYLDGATVQMDSRETYGSAEAAKKAFDRLKQLLASDGYKEG
jgi:predicted DNA-binding WGR domain protein